VSRQLHHVTATYALMEHEPLVLPILDRVRDKLGVRGKRLSDLWVAHCCIWRTVHTRLPTAAAVDNLRDACADGISACRDLALDLLGGPWRHIWLYHTADLLDRWGSLWVFAGWALEGSNRLWKKDFARSIKGTVRLQARDLSQYPVHTSSVQLHTGKTLKVQVRDVPSSGLKDMLAMGNVDLHMLGTRNTATLCQQGVSTLRDGLAGVRKRLREEITEDAAESPLRKAQRQYVADEEP
jgi:hypothetical protein